MADSVIRKTAAQFTSENPILAVSDMGFETDTNKFKYGDGIHHWNDLPYFPGSGAGNATAANQVIGNTSLASIDTNQVIGNVSLANIDAELTAPLAVTATLETASPGRDHVDSVVHDYSISNVTTGAWTQLLANTSDAINELFVFDSSGQIMELGVGAVGFESRVFVIPPGGPDTPVDLSIPLGSRVSVRAITAAAAIGYLVITGLQ